jgi:DNA-binding transcriptional LysR family regulator
MPINDGLPYLPAFVAAAEAGTFSEAAKRLKMTQSAVSKQILSLERNIGATLFDRLPRQLVLTEAGEALATVAKLLLVQLEQVGDSIAAQHHRQPHGPIRIGTTETLGAYVMPHRLRLVVERLPAVQPELQVDTADRLFSDLQQGRLDLIVVAQPSYPEVLEATPLVLDPLCLLASPDLAQRVPAARPLTDLAVPFVLPDSGQAWRQYLESELFAPMGWRPEIGWVVNPTEAIKRFVREGLGMTLLPHHAVAEDLAAGHLVALGSATSLPKQTIDLVRHRHRRAGRVLDAVWETLRSL